MKLLSTFGIGLLAMLDLALVANMLGLLAILAGAPWPVEYAMASGLGILFMIIAPISIIWMIGDIISAAIYAHRYPNRC